MHALHALIHPSNIDYFNVMILVSCGHLLTAAGAVIKNGVGTGAHEVEIEPPWGATRATAVLTRPPSWVIYLYLSTYLWPIF